MPAGEEMMTAAGIYDQLLRSYGTPRWWSDDPYTVIFEAVLVQNTAWSNVEATSKAIGSRMKAEVILSMETGELENLIRPCGFFKAKARTIKSVTAWYLKIINESGNLSTEDIRNEILGIKGIGEETADVILVYALRRPSFILDAYTRRFLERMGIEAGNDGERRAFLTETLPHEAETYGHFHWLILEHGKAHCRKRPECKGCPFTTVCKKASA